MPIKLSVAVTGDRRMVENLILEVRAIAERCGLKIPDVQVISQSGMGPKKAKNRVRSRPRKS